MKINAGAALKSTAIILTVAAVFTAVARYPMVVVTILIGFLVLFIWGVIYYLFTLE